MHQLYDHQYWRIKNYGKLETSTYTQVEYSGTGRALVAKYGLKELRGIVLRSKISCETSVCKTGCITHLVYVDGSRCDERVGLRRTSWAQLGKAPLQGR